ncbi:hypothetical protein KKH46_01615 [Patescibacteria group bacterium]|nr:hypothetical protein [Patescibacteria group bacterium]
MRSFTDFLIIILSHLKSINALFLELHILCYVPYDAGQNFILIFLANIQSRHA